MYMHTHKCVCVCINMATSMFIDMAIYMAVYSYMAIATLLGRFSISSGVMCMRMPMSPTYTG